MGLFLPTRRARGKIGRLLAAGCGAAALLLSSQAAHAQQVTAVYTQSGGFFNYNFTVRNTTAVTLADVNIALPTVLVSAPLTTALGAPTGFQTTVDNGQSNGTNRVNGFIDFTADSDPSTPQDFFANTTVSGFLIRSASQLNGATFNTLNVNGGSFTGTVVATAAPEPGTLGLLAFGAAPVTGAFFAFRRRRFVSSASLKG